MFNLLSMDATHVFKQQRFENKNAVRLFAGLWD